MKTFRIGGVHPHENKISAGQKIQNAPLPNQAVVLLAQHLGAPATPIVEKGTEVKVGQLIATASGFISANVHSPVSGKVAKIDTIVDGWGMKTPAVFIDVEGDEWMENIAFYMVIVVAAMQMVAGESYKKYIRFFAGMILILMLTGPILKIFGMSEFQVAEYQKELEEIENATKYMEQIIGE